MCVYVCVKLQHCVYGEVDVEAENGYQRNDLHFHFFPLLPLFSKTQLQTLTLSVNGPLQLSFNATNLFH